MLLKCSSWMILLSLLFSYRSLLNELDKHDCAWPFLNAVNTKMFPQYKKVIRTPMDFGTMRNKLKSGQ